MLKEYDGVWKRKLNNLVNEHIAHKQAGSEDNTQVLVPPEF